ncbi:MAG TPA: hypothetical protein VF406_20050, partial [Thermodesulfobacteriota bacterium]
ETLVPLADAYTTRWAVLEERALKAAARSAAALLFRATGGRTALAPWLEVVARRRAPLVRSAGAHPEHLRRPRHRQHG